MNHKLTPATALLLTVPPLLWAGNAIVGRLVHELVPPITLNLFRWLVALLILLPLGWRVFRGHDLQRHWRRLSLLGLLGVGLYNALQYMALQTSTPINVTLVAASMPFWMLVTGALFFRAPLQRKQIAGALLSIAGVVLVLCRGEWARLLAFRLVAGDVFIILAVISWAFYSWLLADKKDLGVMRSDWAMFLLAQVLFGAAWSALFAAGEWVVGTPQIHWSWGLAAAILFVGVGPAVTAFRCWGLGVQRVGPNIAAFFGNLTPLFAAIMSSAFLGELPHLYHGVAFAMIVGGILLSSLAGKKV